MKAYFSIIKHAARSLWCTNDDYGSIINAGVGRPVVCGVDFTLATNAEYIFGISCDSKINATHDSRTNAGIGDGVVVVISKVHHKQ